MLYEVYGRMKYVCSNGRKHTYKECEDKRKLLVRYLLHSPFYDLIYCHKKDPPPHPSRKGRGVVTLYRYRGYASLSF